MKCSLFLYALLLTILSACAQWEMVGGKYFSNEENFEVDLPNGWRKSNIIQDALSITRDGMYLQLIWIARVNVEKEPPYTKKKLSKDMLPQEVAELVIDDFRSNQTLSNLQISKNSPELVGGYPGFKLIYSYRTREGLRKKGIYYGILLGNWYYYLYYEAPTRYYFPKDQAVFKNVKKTFKILENSTP